MLKQIGLQEDIRDHKFERITKILRSGQISELKQETLNLLADYLEGKVKRRPGGQTADCNDEEAERIYQELQSYMEYGCSTSEVMQITYDYSDDKGKIKELKNDLRKNGMKITKAREKMAKDSYALLGRKLSPESIRKITEFGEKVYNYNVDRFDEYYNSEDYDGK